MSDWLITTRRLHWMNAVPGTFFEDDVDALPYIYLCYLEFTPTFLLLFVAVVVRVRSLSSSSFIELPCRCRWSLSLCCHRSLIVDVAVVCLVVIIRCPLSVVVVACWLLLVDCCLLASAVVDSGGGDVERTHKFKSKLILCRMCDPIPVGVVLTEIWISVWYHYQFWRLGVPVASLSVSRGSKWNSLLYTFVYIYIETRLPVASYKYELHTSHCPVLLLLYCRNPVLYTVM